MFKSLCESRWKPVCWLRSLLLLSSK